MKHKQVTGLSDLSYGDRAHQESDTERDEARRSAIANRDDDRRRWRPEVLHGEHDKQTHDEDRREEEDPSKVLVNRSGHT